MTESSFTQNPLHARAHRVEVNVPDQFEQIGLFLTNDGVVTVLEKVPGTLVAKVEGDSIASQKAAHKRGEAGAGGTQKQVEVIFQKRPGKTGGTSLN